MPGFSTVKRDGIEVSPNFTSNIDADLRVGAVEETITVTGESPIVDIQSSAQTRAMTDQAFKELPTGGSWIQMAALVPAVRASNTDVGGVLGDQTGAQVSAHGSRPGDGVSLIDGLRIGNMYIDSNLTNMSLSPLLFDQVDVSLSGQMGETGTNGVIMNAIPKAGGNTFSGSALANGSGPALQGSNVTSDLQARGLQGASSSLKTLYDINGAVGGPIKRDKLWFYATSRYFTNEYFLASRFYAVDPTAIARTNDTSNQAYGGTYTYDNNGRVTWAHQRQAEDLRLVRVSVQGGPALADSDLQPRRRRRSESPTWHTQLSTTKWTYAATNKSAVGGGHRSGREPRHDQARSRSGRHVSVSGIAGTAMHLDHGADRRQLPVPGADSGFDFDDRLPSQTFNAAMSYVTGAHNFKVGFEDQRGHFWRGDNNDSTGGIWYHDHQQRARVRRSSRRPRTATRTT